MICRFLQRLFNSYHHFLLYNTGLVLIWSLPDVPVFYIIPAKVGRESTEEPAKLKIEST